MKNRLAIVGSRGCSQIDIASYLGFTPSMIVSGGAIGIDSYAKNYALKNNIPLLEFLPKYHKYGRQAPIMRNIQIVENCDYVLAFWNGSSRGTKFTIDYALKRGKAVRIVRID